MGEKKYFKRLIWVLREERYLLNYNVGDAIY